MAQDVETSESRKPPRLFLVCVPRSVSTAITKCLSSFGEDCEVWFEPFATCRHARLEYKRQTGGNELPPDYEGNEDVYEKAAEFMTAMANGVHFDAKMLSYSVVKRCLDTTDKQFVVVKDIGASLAGFLEYLPSQQAGYKYIFLIRDPHLVASSYRKASVSSWKKLGAIKDEASYDLTKDQFYPPAGLAFRGIHDVWKYVCGNIDPNPLVVDTSDLVSDPSPYLKKICDLVGLEYHSGLLRWDSSSEPMMKWNNPGVQNMMGDALSDFHHKAMTSSEFVPSRTKPDRASLTPDVTQAVDEGLKYYEEMYKQRYIPMTSKFDTE